VESLKHQHSEELSSVRSGHRTEYDELVEKHSQELRELKDGHTRNHADLTSSHSSEVEELKRQIQSITNQLNNEISEAKADHESKLRDAKEQHDSTLNEKETAHATAIENLTNELAAHKVSYEASTTSHTSTKGELKAAENIITELRAKVDDLQQEIVTTKESASTAVATKNDEMVKLTAELVDTREQLGHAQEKLMKFDEMEKLNSETHLRENKERENEIFAKNNEIADLRAKLTVL
jgi:chromosome segregation ATPase